MTDSPEGFVSAEHPGWRRLAAAVLLSGYLARDAEFVNGPWACHLAELLGLPDWPPPRWYTRDELQSSAECNDPESAGRLTGLRSRTAADNGRGWRTKTRKRKASPY